MGPTLVFSQFQVLLSHLWGLKKKKTEGRRDTKGEKEGVEQERREEEGVKRKKKNK